MQQGKNRRTKGDAEYENTAICPQESAFEFLTGPGAGSRRIHARALEMNPAQTADAALCVCRFKKKAQYRWWPILPGCRHLRSGGPGNPHAGGEAACQGKISETDATWTFVDKSIGNLLVCWFEQSAWRRWAWAGKGFPQGHEGNGGHDSYFLTAILAGCDLRWLVCGPELDAQWGGRESYPNRVPER